VADAGRVPTGGRAARPLADVLAVAVGAGLTVLLRLWTSWDARAPQVVADETAYLAMSRLLAGGPSWNLGESAPYMPLYSVFIVPADLLGLSPQGTYRWAIVVNAVLAGLTFLAVESLTCRLTRFRRPWATVVALLALSLPALVLTAGVAWSDNLAPLLFALLALCGLRLLDAPTPGRAAVFALVGVVAYASHARFLPLLVVQLGVLAALAVIGRVGRGVAAGLAGAMAVGVVAVNVGSAHLAGELNMVGRETGEFGRVFHVPALLTSILGQLWYLAVTTGGLAVLGGLLLGRALWSVGRARWRARAGVEGSGVETSGVETSGVETSGLGELHPGQVVFLVALIGLAFATSAGFMADRPRPDHLVYGRYNDMLVAPLVVLGLGSLVWAPRRRTVIDLVGVAASTVAAAAVVWLGHTDTLREAFVPYSILGLFPFDPIATQRLRYVTVVGLAGLAAVGGLAVVSRGRRRPLVLLGGCGVLLMVALLRAEGAVDRYVRADPSVSAEVAGVLEPGQPIVCAAPAGCPLLEFYRYQFYLPDHPFLIVWDEQWKGEEVVLAGAGDDQTAVLRRGGYTERWRDVAGGATLWTR
jgi:hypothetical protein